ncbi:MAG: toprim domain-containing protein [Roseomonas sp.]|nr:toprim domain-containing protein [Roseomonas sp.]
MTLGELKSALADRIEPLALELLQTAPTMRARDEIRFGRKGAFAVRIAGPKRGTFCDYSGSAKGDALALICHARRCEPREAFRWARAWLGATPGSHAPPLPPKPPTPTASPPESGTADLARRLWAEAMPARGTLAEKYLASRGLTLEDAAPLRFHPRAWRNKDCGPPGPAMLALMTCAETGEPVGTHCTYLAPDGSAKAEGERVKVMLGRSGVIRLAPLEGPALGIAEGIETALAVMQRAGWRPVWAATCAGAVGRFPIVPGAESLAIFADADPPGMAAARQAAQRWRNAGKAARIIAPPSGDWDEALKGGRQ